MEKDEGEDPGAGPVSRSVRVTFAKGPVLHSAGETCSGTRTTGRGPGTKLPAGS